MIGKPLHSRGEPYTMECHNSTLSGLIYMENTSRESGPSTQDSRRTVKHYSLILAGAGNLARAGKFVRAGSTFRATPLGLREPPELPSQSPARGYHSSPRSSGDISISHLGVSRGHRNIPHTSHCLYKATPDSSGLRRPPSRTLLLYNGSFLQDPLSLQTIQLFTAHLSFLQKSVHPNVSDPNNKHLNSDKSHNHINLCNTYIYMNTIIRLLYHIT